MWDLLPQRSAHSKLNEAVGKVRNGDVLCAQQTDMFTVRSVFDTSLMLAGFKMTMDTRPLIDHKDFV